MRKRVAWMIAALVIVGIGLFAWRHYASARDAGQPAHKTATVTRGDITATVESTGKVEANQNVDIKCKASGEIIRLPFDISDHVKKGDLLVELDPTDERRAVTQAQAALEASQAQVDIARQNLAIAKANLKTDTLRADAGLTSAQANAKDAKEKASRMQQLLATNLASQEDAETAQTAAIQAQAQLKQAQAAVDDLKSEAMGIEVKKQNIKLAEADLAQKQVNLENANQAKADTKVIAPMDGVVAARDVQTGQIISSGITNVGGGTTVLTLADLSRIFVDASVDESDIGRVRVGQTVRITADAFPGKHFTGKVTQIATQGQDISNVVTFDVKIEITSDNKSLLKPQMTANVSIIIGQAKNVLLVPVDAVFRHKGKPTVALVEGPGKTRDMPVTTGITDYKSWEIKSGLTQGQTVELGVSGGESKWHSSKSRTHPPHGPF